MRTDTKLRKLIAEQMGYRPEEIKDDSRFIEDLGVDSLDTVEIILTVEETFNICIPDEDAAKILTFGDMVKYVERKCAEPKPKPIKQKSYTQLEH
jgi:acyl carrier protein